MMCVSGICEIRCVGEVEVDEVKVKAGVGVYDTKAGCSGRLLDRYRD